MVSHVDFNLEDMQLSSPPLSDSESDKEAQLPWERGEGLDKSCDVITFHCMNFHIYWYFHCT